MKIKQPRTCVYRRNGLTVFFSSWSVRNLQSDGAILQHGNGLLNCSPVALAEYPCASHCDGRRASTTLLNRYSALMWAEGERGKNGRTRVCVICAVVRVCLSRRATLIVFLSFSDGWVYPVLSSSPLGMKRQICRCSAEWWRDATIPSHSANKNKVYFDWPHKVAQLRGCPLINVALCDLNIFLNFGKLNNPFLVDRLRFIFQINIPASFKGLPTNWPFRRPNAAREDTSRPMTKKKMNIKRV